MRNRPRTDAAGRADRTPFWVGAIVAAAALVMVLTYSQLRFAKEFPIPAQGGDGLRAARSADPIRRLGPDELKRLSATAPAAGPSRSDLDADSGLR